MSDHAGPDEPVDPTEPTEPAEPTEPTEPTEAGHDPEMVADGLDDDLGTEPEQPRRYPSTIGGAFYLAVLVAALTSLGIIASGDWRVGIRVLAACLGAAGLMRLVLPERDAGMLAVRHRLFDVVMLVVLAGVLWWLAGSIPDQPPT